MKYFPGIALSIAAILCLMTACGNNSVPEKPVVIEAGKFTSEEPSALHGPLTKSKKCSIDTINGEPRTPDTNFEVKRGASIQLNGWAFSDDGKKVASEVFVRLTGPVATYFAVTTTRFMRSDANQYLSTDPALTGGFELAATTADVEPGIYEIDVLQAFPHEGEFCRGGANLIVN